MQELEKERKKKKKDRMMQGLLKEIEKDRQTDSELWVFIDQRNLIVNKKSVSFNP